MAGLRIVPPPTGEYGHTLAKGTRVFVGSEELQVSRLECTAEVNNVWRCTLETMAVQFAESPPRQRDGPFSLQAMTWTPHEMARYQDAVRGVHRRFADWRRSERGRFFEAKFARDCKRFGVLLPHGYVPPFRNPTEPPT